MCYGRNWRLWDRGTRKKARFLAAEVIGAAHSCDHSVWLTLRTEVNMRKELAEERNAEIATLHIPLRFTGRTPSLVQLECIPSWMRMRPRLTMAKLCLALCLVGDQ
ncbi:hypothetical protein BD309DRAFT_969011 [Dichomitus squalens]|uniref:Uncharacterized protein n=1 Tax=Dichomitus squalens TaxID=114155 RepID=A0A4Q9NJ50_9APHY|nr:hypothetical protein BD309DRAFT_969011 [Dichomitus squalens]TBU55597.1 hypothetical protein BD310DRAFT_680637 [Dichomitus squalens]